MQPQQQQNSPGMINPNFFSGTLMKKIIPFVNKNFIKNSIRLIHINQPTKID
jgi:hypothetical protein